MDNSEVSDFADVSMYVMTPEYGASTQLEKIDMLDYADLVALNKSDKRGALDALQAVRKQFQRNHLLWEQPLDEMPVYATKASQFNDHGTTELYNRLVSKVNDKFTGLNLQGFVEQEITDEVTIIPPKRVRYLSEIVENNRQYDANIEKQAELARTMYHIDGVKKIISNEALDAEYQKAEKELQQENIDFLKTWDDTKKAFHEEFYSYFVRGKEIKVETSTESLSHLRIPKIALPKYNDWGDLIKWKGQENLPGGFPFTAGIYPFKRTEKNDTKAFIG